MKKTTIGGQALIEGLMLIGPANVSIAVRKPDGEIVVDKRPLPAKGKLSKIPVLRGITGFVRQMVLGVKALMYSADFMEIDDNGKNEATVEGVVVDAGAPDNSIVPDNGEVPGIINSQINKAAAENEKKSKLDIFIDKIFGGKIKDTAIYFSVIISIIFSVGLFIMIPNLIAGLLNFDRESGLGVVLYNLFEGLIRVTLFFGYLSLVSRLKDIKRVWQYHGAEHKTIHCYENQEELTVENIRKYSPKHPRCGTSFLFIVMIVSIIVFSFTGWHGMLVNILFRLALVPLVAGLSYELLKFAGRSELKIVKIFNAPGLLFQRFTTSEPDDRQIEVAIAAFNGVDFPAANSDKW